MLDRVDPPLRFREGFGSLTVAQAQIQLIRRRLARGAVDPVAFDEALSRVEVALGRVRDDMRRLEEAVAERGPDARLPYGNLFVEQADHVH